MDIDPQAGSEDEAELSQNSEGKIWSLKDGKMEVGSMGKKKDSDLYMTIDLVFQMDGQTTPIVVGE